MSIDPINIGGAPNDGNGQDLRSGGQIINDNFAELNARTAAAQEKAEQGVSDAAAARDAATEAKAVADAAVPATALGDSVPQLINGVVPASQLPSFVDDVLEFPTLEDFPEAGETGKIYIAVNDGDSPTNPTRQYRWSGSAFVLIPSSPGSTDQVPEGSTNQYFTQSRVRSTTLSGLGALVNAAVLATDTVLQAFAKLQGQLNAKLGKSETAADSEKLGGQPASYYSATMVGATASAAGVKGLVPAPAAGDQFKFLRADGTYADVNSSDSGLQLGMSAWGHRAQPFKGFALDDGQELDRAVYPDFAAVLDAGLLPTVTEAEWQSTIAKRACFVANSSSGKFRMRDLNGAYSGSYGGMFVRGSLAGAGGQILQQQLAAGTGPYQTYATGAWMTRLFGIITPLGAAEASSLATAYASLASRLSTVEGNQVVTRRWTSSQLVLAAGAEMDIQHNMGRKAINLYWEWILSVSAGGWPVGTVLAIENTTENNYSRGIQVLNSAANSFRIKVNSSGNAGVILSTTGASIMLNTSQAYGQVTVIG
ncbi:hypothetical protein ACKWMZ_26930 [Pseudomonas protegens]|uniref:hypothetical protein n=1 Tax=Pseudomonas protegens TaxID=380021 RepID=UPI003967AF8E